MDWMARVLGGPMFAETPGPASDFWYGPASGPMTIAGVRIDEDAAQKLSAWYRGKDLLSTALAMLPFQVFERLPNEDGAEVARQQPLYDVLHTKPNAWMDSFTYRRLAMRHLIDHGSHYAEIIEGPRGFVDQLWPIHPKLVTPRQVSTGRIVYDIRDPKTGQTRTRTQDDIFRLMGASDDGVTSKGILQYARESLGTAMATESYAASVFGRGTINGGLITVPAKLDPQASKNMAESFVTAAGNWALPKVLEQGATWVSSDMSPEDFQMLLSRKFSVDDIARWLGLPPHMLGSLDRATFSNIEHQGQEFVTYALGPWLSLWEFACNDQLVLNTRRFFVEFNRDALVRGAIADRWQAHQIAISTGTFTRNEVRRSENKKALPGLDEPLDPAHLTGKTDTAEPPAKKPAPKAKPVPSDDDAQAHAIVVESAARLIRREIKAVEKAAVRHASDGDAFAAEITEFYAKHAAILAESLLMSTAAAEEYCAGQARQVLAHGVAIAELWQEPTHARGLAAWALDGEAA